MAKSGSERIVHPACQATTLSSDTTAAPEAPATMHARGVADVGQPADSDGSGTTRSAPKDLCIDPDQAGPNI
jgi:hypothetical protein